MRRYADANVILRYLLGDVPEQAEKAREAINGGLWLCEAVLAEVVYVLDGVYAIFSLHTTRWPMNWCSRSTKTY